MIDRRSPWTGRRVTVMGLGTRGGGAGVARYLAQSGANVTVTDLRTESDLADQLADLIDLPIRFVLGRHDPADFTDTDMVVRNPGVRRGNPYLEIAREANVPIEMEMTIFLAACPAPTIGITGTKGKTTTSVLCGEMLRSWRPETVVAGNMGVSAVAALDSMTSDTPVVLELSSWQLEAMDERLLGPSIGVITNISEDHLDTYLDFEDYAATKRSLAKHLREQDHLILNSDDPAVGRAASETNATVRWFGEIASGPGITVLPKTLVSTIPGAEGTIEIPDNPALRGHHQRMNAAGAAAAALIRGASLKHVSAGLTAFGGVTNRMELVAEIAGVTFVNDTAATAPAAAIASIRAFSDRPIQLIAGGADKQLNMTALAMEIAQGVKSVVLLEGTATPILRGLINAAGFDIQDLPAQSMSEAVDRAKANANPGDVVLLSPGCASFGLFRDEFDRGRQFRECVNALIPVEISQ